jgi:hypothetical protein
MTSQSHASHSVQVYAIRIGEQLDDDFATWFGPRTVDHAANGETTLVVHVRDQTELHGLLIKIRDFNLTLIEIVKVEP